MGFYDFIKEMYKKPRFIIPAMSITNWSGFGNQPTNDGVEVGSDSASDTGKCTIWGTTYVGGALAYETVTLTGTTYVATTKTNWGNIYGVFLGDVYGGNITRAVGTVTVREASGNLAITTLTATTFQKGMFSVFAKGLNAEMDNATGKIYWNTLAVATANNGYYDAGTAVQRFYVGVTDYLHIISDNSGCTTSVIIFDD